MPALSDGETFGVAVVAMGGSHLAFGPALQAFSTVRFAGLLTPDDDVTVARSWQRQLGRCRVYRDLSELLADANAEGVLVLSDNPRAYDFFQQTLAAGKPCLVDVAVLGGLEGCIRAGAMAYAAGVVVLPAHLLRYEPAVLRARELLAAGVIGEPVEMRCEWTFSAAWESKTGRPLLPYHLIETLDLCRWLLGSPMAVSADLDGAAEQTSGGFANVIVQHEEAVSVHRIYRTPGSPRYERYVITGHGGMLEVVGPASEVLERDGGLRVILRQKGSDPVSVDLNPSKVASRRIHVRQPYARMIEDFVQAATGQRRPVVTLDDTCAAFRMREAVFTSSREGVKVQLAIEDQPGVNQA